jgi:hypothetical protein
MITTTWTAAPADYLGLGGSGARAHVNPRLQTVQGTAVPFARDRKVFAPAGGERLVESFRIHNCIAPNNGATLGIRSSGRPQS